MNGKTFYGLICILTLALLSTAVNAAPLDKSANAKIDEAINVHYLATNFDKAEGLLRGTIKACGDGCSPSVKARAWMYVGIVVGAGKQDLDAAAAAFSEAVSLDPAVKLDADLATEELISLFAEIGGQEQGGGGDAAAEVVELDSSGGGGASGGMSCEPNVMEVQTRRPVPFLCTASGPVSKVTLHFKPFGGSWQKVNMGRGQGGWQGQIPCSATGLQGSLNWYVVASSAGGGQVDGYGSEAAPEEIMVVDDTAEPPPAFPGKEPPQRCSEAADCPEDMIGTPACPGTSADGTTGKGGWGAACEEADDCQDGLACMEGTCETPPSCETDSDCTGGKCVDFLCNYGGGKKKKGGKGGDGPKNLVSLRGGIDLAQLSGDAICNVAAESDFRCYLNDQLYAVSYIPYTGSFHDPLGMTVDPYTMAQVSSYNPAQSGQIGSSLAPGTILVTASYERLLTENIGVEGTLGAAFGGAPDSGIGDLIHAAVKGKYWFSGTGQGLRLYALLGAGLGQVDAKKKVQVREDHTANSPAFQTYCANNPQTDPRLMSPLGVPGDCVLPVDAYRKFGTSFVTGGLGAFLNLGGHGPALELAAKIMFPASGLVLTPSGGWLLAF